MSETVEPQPEPAGPENQELETRVANLAAVSGQDPSVVRAILVAMDSGTGEPVGTVRINAATGEIAHRVMDRDVVKWRISHPTEGIVYDMAPTKPDWDLVETS